MKSISELSFVVISLVQLKGIGAAFLKKNIANIKNQYHALLSIGTAEIIEEVLYLTNKKYTSLEIKEAISKAEDILDECEASQISFTSIADDNYPKQLFDLKDPPPILFFLGNFSLLSREIVTIVGTRKPNDHGEIIAERIGRHFASKGWVICNGLADGIDTFSIIDREGFCFAQAAGVVGSGLSRISFRSLPKQSIANIDCILDNGGLVLSEMPPSKKQDTFSVVKSCRIQAGIGLGLVLIQSSIDGGSRFTVKAAVDSSRPLGIVYPVKSDIDRDDYTANRKIIEHGVIGLGEFVALKNGIYSNQKIVILSSKYSYPEFESVMESRNKALAFRM